MKKYGYDSSDIYMFRDFDKFEIDPKLVMKRIARRRRIIGGIAVALIILEVLHRNLGS